MILQGDNPLGDIAALAATIYGNVQNSKREKAARDRQATLDQQNAGLAATQNQIGQQNLALGQQQLDQGAQAANTAKSNRTFESGLKYPAGWGKFTTAQKKAYLEQRINAAERAGDQNVIKDTQAEINRLGTDEDRAEAIQSRQSMDVYNQNQQNQRVGAVTDRDQSLNADTTARLVALLGIRGAQQQQLQQGAQGFKAGQSAQHTANSASSSADTYVSSGIRAMTQDNDQAAKAQKDPPNPNMAAFTAGLQQKIAEVRKNPGGVDKIIAGIQASGMSDSQKALATRALQMAADAAKMQSMAAGGKGGGSNATGDPQSPWP